MQNEIIRVTCFYNSLNVHNYGMLSSRMRSWRQIITLAESKHLCKIHKSLITWTELSEQLEIYNFFTCTFDYSSHKLNYFDSALFEWLSLSQKSGLLVPDSAQLDSVCPPRQGSADAAQSQTEQSLTQRYLRQGSADAAQSQTEQSLTQRYLRQR